MGTNDNLAGTVTGVGETSEGRGSGSKSDRSNSKKPSRGAPPSSLSQPILTDRSRSSSPSKSDRNSSLPPLKNSSPPKASQAPSNIRPSNTFFNKNLNVASTQRGRSGSKGRAVFFKHHQLLPRAAVTTSPTTLSFQPQSSTSDTQLRSTSSYRAFEFKTSAPISPTTNINVSGEILPSPSVSQQINVPLATTTAESIPTGSQTNDHTIMSSTVESTSSQTFRPGSERGYDSSPMARLIQQYKEDSNDDDTSTWQRAVTLSSKKSLLANDIVEKRGDQQSYLLQPALFEDVNRVVSELQIFLERASALVPERLSYFKVDPRDTFLEILRESSDLGQIHAAWMGLSRRLTLAQENLTKYEIQYRKPIEGEDLEVPMSPLSTDIGIYEAIEGEDDKDFRMRYIYENVPHHQDQVNSPHKLRDGTPWNSIISSSGNVQNSASSTLPTIPEQEYIPLDDQGAMAPKRDTGKRRITDEFASPPTSPRIMNVGFGTPFKSSSQFFVRPGIPLPRPETSSQRNVLLGLGLPKTPAFESITSEKPRDSRNPQRHHPQSRVSNPF